MLQRGDINKILEQFNGVLAKAFARIERLEDKVQALEHPPKAAPRATKEKA